MASEEGSRVALLSIRPEYVKAIIAGTKQVEFRRKMFVNPVDHIVIYATSPVCKVVAFFRVSYITHESPDKLWKNISILEA